MGLIKQNKTVVGFIILCIVVAAGFARIESVARDSRQVAFNNQKLFCATSRQRWEAQAAGYAAIGLVGDEVTAHRVVPPDQVGDLFVAERYAATNKQLDKQREQLHRLNKHLYDVLGKEPNLC